MTTKHDEFSLDAKYTQEDGTVFLSGIQALVRLPLDQHRADRRRGLRTATFISGYRGWHHGVFSSGLNEDLGATAVFGSQMVNSFPRPKYDGVLGMWYGKAPGVDRTGDVFKHANYAGVGKNGGVLALAGDDPISKSSTLPSHSEWALADAFMPTLYPGNVQEILDLGLHGFMLSRVSGLWAAMKIVTNVADETGTIEVGRDRIQPEIPTVELDGKPFQHQINLNLIPPYGLDMERTLHLARLELARHAGRVARHPHHRQDLLRRAPGLRGAGPGRGRPPPLRRPHPPDGAHVSDGAAHHPRVRPRPRGDPRGRGEAALPRDGGQGRALRLAGPAARGGEAGRGGARPHSLHRRAGLRHHRACAGPAPGPEGAPRVRGGAHPAPGRAEAPAAHAHAGAHRLLLLGLPAQPLHGGAGGRGGGGGHRLPRHGHGHGPRHHRRHPHGRRGRAVGGYRALHRDSAHVPEHRRRHPLPLGQARHRLRGGRRRQHHLQDPLQRGGGDDGGAGGGGGHRHPRPDSPAPGGRRQEDPHHHRPSRELQGNPRRRRGVAPRPAHRGAVPSRRHARRHRAHPRPAVRGGEAPAAETRASGRARAARLHQRARLRRVWRLRQEVELPLRAAGGNRVRPQDPDPPVLLQQGLLVSPRRLPLIPDH